ncbi:aspartate-semialdehyde dehydrogenase [Halopseudomonas salegens]|uniref:Aspartate semialdehyde dehydrogenase n=1 Tax=Halopseudomonas salegens TaxID=1434072 RepID=A0A1H2F231_9GAMM|nr:aspartate-semialdehyde dehydrogenase [Halopseudomonas salegens]SDU01401.1 aspartate semialdehyde dehydrogenase [Halopseudomonas salegens]
MATSAAWAIVGVNSMVGENLVALLDEHSFGYSELALFETAEDAGGRLLIAGESRRVEPLEKADFSRYAVVIFATEAAVSAEWAPRAVAAGCWVIDTSEQWQDDTQVPMLVADVNAASVLAGLPRGLLVSPDSQVVQAALVLQPLLGKGLRAATISTYQSLSTQGRSALEAMALQTGKLLNGQPVEGGSFEKQAAFNLLPRIGAAQDDGSSAAEARLVSGLRRVLPLTEVPLSVTAVLVPVFYGSGHSLQLELEQPVDRKALASLLRKGPAIKILDKPAAGGFPTPVTEAAGDEHLWVGRIRQDSIDPKRVSLWSVADNLRVGVARNTLQVAELLIKDYL